MNNEKHSSPGSRGEVSTRIQGSVRPEFTVNPEIASKCVVEFAKLEKGFLAKLNELVMEKKLIVVGVRE